jgi:hypothetical protein
MPCRAVDAGLENSNRPEELEYLQIQIFGFCLRKIEFMESEPHTSVTNSNC